MVDHLAAASETYTNVSSIECPAKPTNYTCPKVLTLNKEELKKKICDYESVLSGSITFVPDNEKSETRCGSMKAIKQDTKPDVECPELPEKVAVVMGKDCPAITNDTIYMLLKTPMKIGTKFIIADGSEIELLNSQSITKEEIAGFIKQCPKQVRTSNWVKIRNVHK